MKTTITQIRNEIRAALPPVQGKRYTFQADVAASWCGTLDDLPLLRLSYAQLCSEHREALRGWLLARGWRVWSHETTGSRWSWRHVLVCMPDHAGFSPDRSAAYYQQTLP